MKLLTAGSRYGRKGKTAPQDNAITSAAVQKRLSGMEVQEMRQKGIKVEIRFNLNAEGARSVAVAGSFNDWNPNKARLKKDGETWTMHMRLPRGRHEYRFVVDGKWVTDPSAKEFAPNPFGDRNSVLSV